MCEPREGEAFSYIWTHIMLSGGFSYIFTSAIITTHIILVCACTREKKNLLGYITTLDWPMRSGSQLEAVFGIQTRRRRFTHGPTVGND